MGFSQSMHPGKSKHKVLWRSVQYGPNRGVEPKVVDTDQKQRSEREREREREILVGGVTRRDGECRVLMRGISRSIQPVKSNYKVLMVICTVRTERWAEPKNFGFRRLSKGPKSLAVIQCYFERYTSL